MSFQQVAEKLGVGKSQQPKSAIHWFAAFNIVMAAMLTTGCGGGGGSSSESASAKSDEQGELAVAITDAEGDFLSYTVDVTSITLEKANGAVVETVPLNSRIDFAQYTDMTEFFTIRTLPAGNYTNVNLNLDFTNANIVLQDEDGDSHQAIAVNDEGTLLTSYTVNVALSEDQTIKIRKGVPAKLTVDFDLDSSNTILSYDPGVVEVEPFILANASLDTEREHRGRGQLQSVDVNASTFSMDIKPFHHRAGEFGEVTLRSLDRTQYEINAEQLEGEAGLLAMSELPVDTPLIVYGQVNEGLQFNALYVLAGTSVPWVGRDVARGVVVARDGDELTIRGSHVERSNGSVAFLDDIKVMLGEGSNVTRQALSNEGLTHDDVSVGQRVVVFGQMSGDALGEYEMDATEGHVRLLVNLIKGEVTSVSPLVVDLRWVNGRRLSLFDFAGTGASESLDASPDSYEINPTTLSLDNLEVGSLVKVRGYPAAFGTAPEDFDAQTIVDINTDQRAGAMNVVWSGVGSSTPFIASNDDSLVLNVEDADYEVKLAGVPLDYIGGLQNDPVVEPLVASGRGVYALKHVGRPAIQIFNSFENYVEALNSQLSSGNTLRRMVSLGRYDQVTDTMGSVVVTSRLVQSDQ